MDLPHELALIHQPTRLRIMALLYKHRDISFTQTRNTLNLTDGNLASHAQTLQDAGYLDQRDALTPDGFEKRYRITPQGSHAFQRYLNQLTDFLASLDSPED